MTETQPEIFDNEQRPHPRVREQEVAWLLVGGGYPTKATAQKAPSREESHAVQPHR